MKFPSLRFGIRRNLVLAFSVLITMAMGGMIFLEMGGLPGSQNQGKFDQFRSNALSDMQLVSGLLAQRLSTWSSEARADATVLATNPLLVRSIADTSPAGMAEVGAQFHSFISGNPTFESLALFDARTTKLRLGVGLDASVQDLADLGVSPAQFGNLTTPGYHESIRLFRQANGQIHLQFFHQVVSPEHPDRLDGIVVAQCNVGSAMVKLIWAVSTELPAAWDCQIAGRIDGHLYQISKNLHDAQNQSEFYPVDSAFEPVLLALDGVEGPFEGRDANGIDCYAFHRQIKIADSINLALVLRIDRELALRPAQEDLRRQVGLWLLLLAGVIGIAFIMANQISRPIKGLISIATRIQAGDLTARANLQSHTELDKLATVFNDMVARIQTWGQDLEHQIQERTHETQVLALRQAAILIAVPDIIMEVDLDKVYTWANAPGLDFFGADVIGHQASDYFVGEQDTYQRVQPLIEGSDLPIYIESWQRRSDGESRLLAWWCKVLQDEHGQVTGMLSTARDITDMKRIEEKTRQSLREKETLLQEVHHRTKNTLQLIQGLLVLQASKYPDSREFQELVQDTDQRIQAIALVHQMLYRSRDLSMISIREYLTELTGLLRGISARAAREIRVDLQLAERSFTLDTVIPLGLILNELMSNSIKYAFPEGKGGLITITLDQLADGWCRLGYRDNGQGVPEGFDFRTQASLGLRLIFSIGEMQLQGKITMEGHHGLNFSLIFPDLNIKPRV